MKLEQQVCSLEYASKLNELGVPSKFNEICAPQNSYFFWYGGKVCRGNQLTQDLHRHAPPVSAFTVSELGKLIPWSLQIDMFICQLSLWHSNDRWHFEYWSAVPSKRIRYSSEQYDSEADARAGFLIFLIENGHVELCKLGGSS